MESTFFPEAADFRQWLLQHHLEESELWVGFYKKRTKIPSITWPESVQQALCFGWIDGLRKSIDDKSYRIRFTPRRPKSNWSLVNIKFYAELEKKGLLYPAGIAAYQRHREDSSGIYTYEQEEVKLAPIYEKAIQAQPNAWAFFQSLPPSAKRLTIRWVMTAKRATTRERRLQILIQSAEAGLRIPSIRRK